MSSRLPVEPLFFNPIYKETIWGGRNLHTLLHKEIPEGKSIGESWEISGVGKDQTEVCCGALAGMKLGRIYNEVGKELVGPIGDYPSFPLLFKFIDAQRKLSVQVHPNDMQARKYGWGDLGKTECWYILDAPKDAQLIIGFKHNVSKEEVREAVGTNSLEDLLNYVNVAPGEVYYIPAGTVHAILDKILLYEVQETSDTTLRLYDWGRVDVGGKPRPLHLQDALEVIDLNSNFAKCIEPVVFDYGSYTHKFRIACRYFSIEEFSFCKSNEFLLPLRRSFRVISVIGEPIYITSGNKRYLIKKGSTILLPPVLDNVKIGGSNNSKFLMTTVPDLKKEIISYLNNSGITISSIKNLGGSIPSNNDLLQFF